MKKIVPKKVKKIWGYELWLHSSYEGNMTHLENGERTKVGPLIKIIKADRPLSIQVHPDDEMAKKIEGEPNGKSECWYVLEVQKETKFIVGINNFNEEFIKKSLKNKTFINLLKTHKPNLGEFINIPAGLVHGIGGGSKVLEVQQPSDTTYRFYDYDRLENGKHRELHVDKSILAMKNFDWQQESMSKDFKKYKCGEYTMEFHKQNAYANVGNIIIDINKECAYISEGEEVDLEHFAIIIF